MVTTAGLLCCFLFVHSPPQQPALFEFHSAFWTNLHHFLHALTRPSSPLAMSLPAEATVEERARWNDALGAYRARYAQRSLLFDQDLVRANLQLAAAESLPSLGDLVVPSDHRAVLESAAAIYRKYWWRSHDTENKAFVSALEPLLKQHGTAIAARLAATYGATWPSKAVRIDLVHDAGPPGNAYTTNDPTHITIGVHDKRHQGVAALEIVFHEASHGWDEVLIKGVAGAAKRAGVPEPANLWHGLLFFNAGTIVKETLAAAGVRDYEMYMEKEGMFDRAYRGWREPIVQHWPAFLAGKISRDEAIELILKRPCPLSLCATRTALPTSSARARPESR
jgi:hypothetical protein